MSNSSYDSHLETAGLLARLTVARRRYGIRDAARGVAWSALAAALVIAFPRVASLSPWTSTTDPDPAGYAWLWGGAAFGFGLLATAIWVRRRLPDLLEIARRADLHFQLDERLSTAVELESQGARASHSSPVAAALFRDAAAHAPRVDARQLAPIGVPRPAIALALGAIALLALELTTPANRSATAPGASILATAAGRDADAAAEVILDIAALVRDQAERESNDYLRVVANSLEQLATDVIEQDSGGQAVADELARLLSHAEAASDVSESDAGAEGLSLTLANVEEFLRGKAEEVARADASTRESSESDGDPSGAESFLAEMMARARAMLEPILAALAGERSDADLLAGDPAESDSSSAAEMEGEESAAPSVEASVVAGERPVGNVEMGDGAIANTETESGGGRPMQGVGGASALAETERMDVPDVSSSQDFELPTEGGSRRRLPEEIVPQTRFTEVAESPLPTGDWQQTTQEHLSSGYLGVSYRDVASRYFLARIRMAEVVTESPEP